MKKRKRVQVEKTRGKEKGDRETCQQAGGTHLIPAVSSNGGHHRFHLKRQSLVAVHNVTINKHSCRQNS